MQDCLFTSGDCIGTRSLSIWPMPCLVEATLWVLREASSGLPCVLF
jgi:hypothetical protein